MTVQEIQTMAAQSGVHLSDSDATALMDVLRTLVNIEYDLITGNKSKTNTKTNKKEAA